MKKIGKVPSTRVLQQAANLPNREKLISFDLMQADQLMCNIIAMKPSDFKNQMIGSAELLQSLIQERMCFFHHLKYIRVKQQLRKKKQKRSLFACFKVCLSSLSSTLSFRNSQHHVEPQGLLSAYRNESMQQLNMQRQSIQQRSNPCGLEEQQDREQQPSSLLNGYKQYNRRYEQCHPLSVQRQEVSIYPQKPTHMPRDQMYEYVGDTSNMPRDQMYEYVGGTSNMPRDRMYEYVGDTSNMSRDRMYAYVGDTSNMPRDQMYEYIGDTSNMPRDQMYEYIGDTSNMSQNGMHANMGQIE